MKLINIYDYHNISGDKVPDKTDVCKALYKYSRNNLLPSILNAYRNNKNYILLCSNVDKKYIRILICDKRSRMERYVKLLDELVLTDALLDLTRYRASFVENTQ